MWGRQVRRIRASAFSLRLSPFADGSQGLDGLAAPIFGLSFKIILIVSQGLPFLPDLTEGAEAITNAVL
jgi:hypothetical protein